MRGAASFICRFSGVKRTLPTPSLLWRCWRKARNFPPTYWYRPRVAGSCWIVAIVSSEKCSRFYDEHGLDQQRAYAIICLMIGSNDEDFKVLADWVQMPQARQKTCRNDYGRAKYAWETALKT